MNSELHDALRVLRKGDGLTLTSLAMHPKVEEVFGTEDFRAIRRAIVAAIASEHDDKGVAALANALGVDTPGGLTLMERRERYIKQHRMSMRTLTNYEEFGIVVIAQMLPVPLHPTPTGELGRDLALVEEVIQRAINRGKLTDHGRTTALEALRRLHHAPDEKIGVRERDRVLELLNQLLQLAAESTRAEVTASESDNQQREAVPRRQGRDGQKAARSLKKAHIGG